MARPEASKVIAAPATAKERPNGTRDKRIYQDNFIREIRISYETTRQHAIKMAKTSDIARFVRSILHDNSREHLIALFLDTRYQVIGFSIVSIGTADAALVHPREIFQRAICGGAVYVALAHNHPSNSVEPSSADRRATEVVRNAGALLNIPLIDHVIVTDTGHLSIKD